MTGVAGALLAVKREEDFSGGHQRGGASKVTTRQLRAAPALGGARLRPAAQSAAAGGFGYGEASDESDESREEPENGVPPRSRQHAPLPAPARVPTEKRNRNLISGLMGHLASAKRQLSDEGGFRGGMRVKEEPRWEPEKASPARGSAGADDAAKEESADEEEAQTSPPRKRAKLSDVKLSGKNSKRQQSAKESAEDAAKAEVKEMQNLQKRLEFHYSSMKNFIRTRAEPTIFYLPKKHNSESKRQLEETRTAIGQKISSLKVHLQSTAASDDEEDDNDGGGSN